jgi:L-alanine-DL-glutamate epimerase-like enolase superfamily enzyme
MKISDIRAVPLSIPMRPMRPASAWAAWSGKQVIVRVLTDEGIEGVGETFAFGSPPAVAAAVEDALKPLLLGQDPTRVEYLADLMQRSAVNYARAGLGMYAIGGVEMALWDLLGKARGLPLYELLGGLVRRRLRAYASMMRYDSPAEVAAACERLAAQGYTLLKLHQTDVASVQAAREAVGPGIGLMLDANCPWTPGEAVEIARALEPYGLLWLEEPVWPPEDHAGLARVRRESPIPIAAGENESTVFGFRELIATGAADVLQPDVAKVGGIGETRKILALATAANLPVALHSWFYGPALAATVHVAAVMGGTTPVEVAEGELEAPTFAPAIMVKDGWIEPLTGPGLGVELDEETLRRYPYTADSARPFLVR